MGNFCFIPKNTRIQLVNSFTNSIFPRFYFDTNPINWTISILKHKVHFPFFLQLNKNILSRRIDTTVSVSKMFTIRINYTFLNYEKKRFKIIKP